MRFGCRWWIVLIGGIAVLSTSQAQEPPLELKGLVPGMTLSEAKASLPALTCQPVPSSQQAIAGGSDTICKTDAVTLGGAKTMAKIAMAKGKILVVIFNEIDPRDFEGLKSLLSSKFGEPSHGGEINGSLTLRWERGGRRLGLVQHDRRFKTNVFLGEVESGQAGADAIRAAKEKDL